MTAVRSKILELDPNLVVDSVSTGGELVSRTLTSQATVAKLSALFGALVLVLVSIGLYGSMSYAVVARTKEIGVRMALGARRWDVIWMVTRESCLTMAAGIAVGIPAGVAATGLFKAMLFGVSQADPVSMVVAIATLVAIAVAAAVLPSRRAASVDPMVALRYE